MSVRGFIRHIEPRYKAPGQRREMDMHSISTVYVEGETRGGETRADLINSLRKGDEVAVLHAFLLADPANKRRRGGIRADLWTAFDEIEAKGASVWELSTGLRSKNAKQRDKMTRAAIEALTLGRHMTSRSDKRGRPAWVPTEDETAKAKAIWESRKYKAARALELIRKDSSKRWTKTRLYRTFGARNAEET